MEANNKRSNQFAPQIADIIFSRCIKRKAGNGLGAILEAPDVSDTWEPDGGRTLRTGDECTYDWCCRTARRIETLIAS